VSLVAEDIPVDVIFGGSLGIFLVVYLETRELHEHLF
jgi:hypothetical protein